MKRTNPTPISSSWISEPQKSSAPGTSPVPAMIDFYAKSFAQEFRSLDRNKTYLVYCRSGNRSGQLMQAVEKMDFK